MTSGRARRRSSRELYDAAIENLDVRFTPEKQTYAVHRTQPTLRGGIQ